MNPTETLVKAAYSAKVGDVSGASTDTEFTGNVSVARAAAAESRELTLTRTRWIDVDKARLRERRIYIDPDDKDTAIAISAYRNLRTHVLKTMSELSARSLMVTGTTKGVGKTLTAINLAISIARHARRTALLVDLDLRDPSVHRYFDFEPDGDIVDVAEGRKTLLQTLVAPGVDRLSILPGKGSYENSSELLSWSPMQDIISEITSRYEERVVIFDAPPILGCDDVAAATPMIDGCLLVVEEGSTNRSELRESLKRLGGISMVGVVLNKSKKAKLARYYY